jgi:hypothetical protein
MDTAHFIGRTRAIAELDALLTGPGRPVGAAAIVGMPGVGKTALAVHWAQRVRARFPDGQLFVDLRGYADGAPVRPIEALAGFLRAFDVAAARIPVDLEEAAGLFRTVVADKRVLVVLDNARDANQIQALLPGGPGCLVLVTSRDSLSGLVARAGARRLTLGGLAPDEARLLLGGVLGRERVTSRVAAANVDARPGRDLESYVDELVRADRLGALGVDGDGDAAVRATFDLSYAALPASTRRLFRLLAVAPGPSFTIDAAAALAGCSRQESAGHLGRLARTHLIDAHAPGRYSLHDLLRLYGRERVDGEDDPNDVAAALANLLAWYRDLANAADRILRPAERPNFDSPSRDVPFHDEPSALAWFEAEAVNLAAAVEVAAAAHSRLAWQLAAAMYGWLQRRSHRSQWIRLYEAAATAARTAGDPHGEGGGHRPSRDCPQPDRRRGAGGAGL